MMIDISSASSKARAREKVRSLVVASHRKQEANQVSEREREDPIARQPESERERDDRDGRTTRRRENGGKVRRSIGIEIESQEFFIRATLHGARIARNPRGATARPSRQGAAPTPDPILRGV